MATYFKNSNDEIVTEQQAAYLKRYSKVYEENNEIKKLEHFADNTLSFISYYKSAGETDLDIIQMFSSTGVQYNIMTKAVLSTNRILCTSDTYEGEELKFKDRILYDDLGREICSEEIDIILNQVKYEETEKNFYSDFWESGEPRMSAYYKENGDLDYMIVDENTPSGQDQDYYRPGDDFEELARRLNIPITDLDYYMTAALEL